jgi:H+-transporting ATPase
VNASHNEGIEMNDLFEKGEPALTPKGLTTAEAEALLRQYGLNAIREEPRHPLFDFLKKMWGPVPWMLEGSVLLELFMRKFPEAGIIAALVLFNAVIGTIQESRSEDALQVLKQRLKLLSRAFRDGHWLTLPAEQIVPGDVVHLRMGDLVPADVRILDGHLSLDQSALTGESLPVDAGAGQTAFAGTTIKHGESTGEVIATGARTKFGKTAELVRLAKTKSHLEQIVLGIVRYLVIFDALLGAIVIVYALMTGVPLGEILPFTLILLVASVPVALPATFTIATALGSRDLAHKGVLVTHLAAIEEAAGMDILCSDKTGTITENRLAVAELMPYPPHSETDLLRLAAMACDDATQDPIDLAIIDFAKSKDALNAMPQRVNFIPFDPATKRSEATYKQADGLIRVAKGAPNWIAPLCTDGKESLEKDEETLAAQGYRVLAVAEGTDNTMRLAGLVALQDPPRGDSKNLIGRLKDLGIRIVMVTGDGLETARAVAEQVGIGNRACHSDRLQSDSGDGLDDCDVFAEVLPEHKFRLVQLLQKRGHTAGMTGDGVNDAPALKQAQVGIAVSNATDVAKAAASIMLTEPGLGNIVAAVEESRCIYQRMLTYTLNKIIKTINVVLFLSLGFILAHAFIVTPLLIVLMMFANDFATMSIATDSVVPSAKPDRWNIRSLVAASVTLGVLILVLSFAVYLVGISVWHMSTGELQTLNFLTLIFTGQGTIYLVRERHHFWRSMPSRWLLTSSFADIVIIGLMARFGILMTAIPLLSIVVTMGMIAVYLLFVDFVKLRIFAALRLH